MAPDWGRTHLELARKGVTLVVLGEKYPAFYREQRSWRYPQFCRHYKSYAKRLKRPMRQLRRAGEQLFIVVHHSDRGSQYAARDYRKILAARGLSQAITALSTAARGQGLPQTVMST